MKERVSFGLHIERFQGLSRGPGARTPNAEPVTLPHASGPRARAGGQGSGLAGRGVSI